MKNLSLITETEMSTIFSNIEQLITGAVYTTILNSI